LPGTEIAKLKGMYLEQDWNGESFQIEKYPVAAAVPEPAQCF
jgi:hypothetical protein